MGNKFGNFASVEAAAADLLADGFEARENGLYAKRGMSGGNLMEAPRRCVALVEIVPCRVDGRYAADGKDYFYYQQHFI